MMVASLSFLFFGKVYQQKIFPKPLIKVKASNENAESDTLMH